LWTLDKGLGDEFTPATREAWTQAYTTLAGVMMAAAAERAGAGEPLAATS
jgi:nitric oxide dioxygenase